ncbi:Helix-turn-helix domain protein [Streptomyces sp. ADI98-12]|uniref:helix-turn-helix domain-containing protein n=1 Tax=Streptomyces sp. ADI98-12 TaxID=1522764 RepID=UPI000F5540F4|nr:helix-turn-helix domain-containing protein [Streptomyces sp. ADI98-12]RPK78688.1 Helix-turn-helix domain protein [Streptomyces sp. ADI98-12]
MQPPPPSPSSRPLLTQVEAAAACGVSRSTIRRAREAGHLPGATRHPARGWLIPVEDLLAAGYRLHAPAPPDTPGKPAPASGSAIGHPVGHGSATPAHPPGHTPVTDPATRPYDRPDPVTPGHPLLIAPATGSATVGHPATPGHTHDDAAAAARAEATRLRTELTAARAEAARLRTELGRADSHLADLQRVVHALTAAPERAALAADSPVAGHRSAPTPPAPPDTGPDTTDTRPRARLWDRIRRR